MKIPIDIEVQPSLVMTMSAADAAPFLGKYTYVDSSRKTPKTMVLTVTHENGTLKGEFEPADPYFRKFALIRIAPDWFAPGVYDKNGQIYEVYRPEITYEFTRKNGRAMSLLQREEDDHVSATGTRIP